MEQQIRFLDFEDRRLAYSTFGEGPPIVFGPRWVSHLEEEWADPRQRTFYEEVARTASCGSIASAAGSRRVSSTRARRSRPSLGSSRP